MIRNNLFYKLLSLGIAIVLWTYVNAERNPQARKSFTVGIQHVNLAKGYTAEFDTQEVNVSIKGPKSIVDTIRRDDIRATVDLSSVNPNGASTETNAKVRVSVLDVAEGTIEYSYSPRSVRVTVEALSSRRLPVEVKYLAAPPLGYAYGDPVLSPASVSVSGKSTEVARVKRIVLTLPAKNANGPVDDKFDVVAVDSQGKIVDGVNLDTKQVRLKMDLIEVPATKAVIVSENIVGKPKYPAKVERVSIIPSSVTLKGKPRMLMEVSTITTNRISIEGAESTISRDVELRVPPGVSVVGQPRVRVTVYITKPETAE